MTERLGGELGGAAPAFTFITSIYFDGPELPLTLRALARPHDCLKVRTKEYFPDLGAPARARVVLEAKLERRGLTHKKRVWVTRQQLRSAAPRGIGVRALIARGRLAPVLGVTYARQVYQRTEAWRVTVDRSIAYHRVDADVALAGERLGPEQLGAPWGWEPRVVVEIKHLGKGLPPWLSRLASRSTPPYSKFVEGMNRIQALRVDQATGG
jgi:hypothetical protein